MNKCFSISLFILIMSSVLYAQKGKLPYDVLVNKIEFYINRNAPINTDSIHEVEENDTSVIVVSLYKNSEDTIWVGIAKILLNYQLDSTVTFYTYYKNKIIAFRLLYNTTIDVIGNGDGLFAIDETSRKNIIRHLIDPDIILVSFNTVNLILKYNLEYSSFTFQEFYHSTYNMPEEFYILYP